MAAIDVRVTAEGWEQWQWCHVGPSDLQRGDRVDIESAGICAVINVILESPGAYRVELLPNSRATSAIKMRFTYDARLRVRR